MARTPRNLDELKTSIEESMAEALNLTAPREGELAPHESEPAPAETVPTFTATALAPRSDTDRLADACNKTAADIEAAGEAVVQVANSIAAETQALAELLRKHGAAIATRIEEFSAMSKRVSEKRAAAREEVLGASGSAPSLAPQLGREEKA
jgi:hypothetical protein